MRIRTGLHPLGVSIGAIDTRFVAVVTVLRCRLYYRIVHVVDVLLLVTCSEDDILVFTQTR